MGLIPGSGMFSGGGNGNSSILAWVIPWTEEPGRLQSMGLQRVGHDSAHIHKRDQRTFVKPNSAVLGIGEL